MTVGTPSRVDFERVSDPRKLVTARADRVRFLYVPYRRYFTIDGTEKPGGQAFQAAIGALYPVAYTLHFALKRRGVDAPVGALEGIFWIGFPGPTPLEAFATQDETRPMHWRLLLPVPDEATEEEVEAAIDEVQSKKRVPALRWLRCEGWLEGECAQILHIGAYDAEYATISQLHAAIADAGLQPRGSHHEIYLSTPSTPPQRMKTVIRQPVEEPGW